MRRRRERKRSGNEERKERRTGRANQVSPHPTISTHPQDPHPPPSHTPAIGNGKNSDDDDNIVIVVWAMQMPASRVSLPCLHLLLTTHQLTTSRTTTDTTTLLPQSPCCQ